MTILKKPIFDQDDAYEHPLNYRIFVEDEFKWGYDPTSYSTVEAVIEHILTHVATLREDGLKEWDLCLWQACRVIAVIRTEGGDLPTVVRF